MKRLIMLEAREAWKLQKHESLFIRELRCNKGACRQCPHAHYAYSATGFGKARKHRYLGTCTEQGLPRKKYTSEQLSFSN